MKKFWKENWLPTSLIIVVMIGVGIYLFANFIGGSDTSNIRENNNQNPYNITNLKAQNDWSVKIAKTGATSGQTWTYTNPQNEIFKAGMPIVMNENTETKITVDNESGTATNIHWHGLTTFPADQDGALNSIKDSERFTYDFSVKQAGTFWYHSHTRPVSEQVSGGMYGPLVVRAANEPSYNLDQIYVLGTNMINGETSRNYSALTLNSRNFARLRFINQSVEYSQDVNFPFDVKVIARDGENLAKNYTTRQIHLDEGQRIDVEIATDNKDFPRADFAKFITINDGSAARIPVVYHYQDLGGKANAVEDPAAILAKSAPANLPLGDDFFAKNPDFSMELSENMSSTAKSGMDWTINGKVFAMDMAPMNVKVGQVYKVRFTNPGMMGVAHPIHIHGAHFQVVAINGAKTNDETFYDTYAMKAGETTDIAVRFDEAGVWVVHCHILIHEDDGMMAIFKATN
jgi:FtsP/CotA-like multicopper oxidase with cupredoxin domain